MDMGIGDIRAAVCMIHDRAAFLKDLKNIAAANNTCIICFNADMVAGKAHVRAAIDHAVRSFCEGNAISNTLEMEALLYAAGSRQCNIGTSFGIHEGENQLWVCCYPDVGNAVFSALEPVMQFVSGSSWNIIDPERQKRLMDLFGITPGELKTQENETRIVDLVLERVALLDALR
ncbi:MAG: KEOPS complex subunit Cgi121 [Methanoregula sp.]